MQQALKQRAAKLFDSKGIFETLSEDEPADGSTAASVFSAPAPRSRSNTLESRGAASQTPPRERTPSPPVAAGADGAAPPGAAAAAANDGARETLDDNRFLQELRGEFGHVFAHASDKQYCICVPCRASLLGFVVSEDAVNSHVLMPAATPGEYVTLNRRRVTIDKERRLVHTCDVAWRERRAVRILETETWYNTRYQPFTLMLLDEPLEGGVAFLFPPAAADGDSAAVDASSPMAMFPASRTYSEYVSLLTAHGNTVLVSSIVPLVCDFSSQPIPPHDGQFREALARLQDIVQLSLDVLVRSVASLRSLCERVADFRDELAIAVECFVLGGVHSALFAVMSAYYSPEETHLRRRRRVIARMPLSAMDIPTALHDLDLAPAVDRLSQLALCRTPIEKRMVMQGTVDELRRLVGCAADAAPAAHADDLAAPDVTLWLLAAVIARSGEKHLTAHLVHAKKFVFYAASLQVLAYSLATFEAAMAFCASGELPGSYNDATLLDSEDPSPPVSPSSDTNGADELR